MLTPERRKEIERISEGVNNPEEYVKMKSELMGAMSAFADCFSELMADVAQTYKQDTGDLLAEIDRLQSACDAQTRIIADSEGIELERDHARLEIDRLTEENATLKEHIDSLKETTRNGVTKLMEEIRVLRQREENRGCLNSGEIG